MKMSTLATYNLNISPIFYCSVAPGVAVPPWATETVLSPWLAADEARVSHVPSHVVWWKKKKKTPMFILCTYLKNL